METQFLNQPGGKIAYEAAGRGPLVLTIPSLGDLRGEYRFLVPQLVSAGYRVASMDLRGLGESSPVWPDYSVAGVGSDLVALVRALGGGPAVLVGTSMGAGAAVWAAAEAPDLVSGLVLIGPFVRGRGSRLANLVVAMLFSRPWGPAVWLKYYNMLYPARKPADFQPYLAGLGANLKEPGRLKALREMLSASKIESEVRLPRVEQPNLVLMGSRDPDFKDPESEARWVAESLRGSYRLIENAGHYPHAEFPEVTGPLIISHLASITERAGAAHAA
jgi:pimeloyl-ACP methyl ester carboxylesterase